MNKVTAGTIMLCFLALLLANCGAETQDQRTGGASAPSTPHLAPPNATQDRPGLRIVPTTDRLGVTEAGVVEIHVNNVANLYGLHLSLRFDPQLLRVQDINPNHEGIQIAPGVLPAPDFTVINTANNERGTIEYAVTQLSPREPARGDGVVAIIHFQGVNTGVSPLSFSYVKLAGPDGRGMPVQPVDTTLEVN